MRPNNFNSNEPTQKKMILGRILLTLLYLYLIIPNSNTCKANSFTSKDPNSTQIIIVYKTMTYIYKGEKKKVDQTGEVIFDKDRIIMKSGEHKEWFKIVSISKNQTLIKLETHNSQNDQAIFNVKFINDNFSNISADFSDVAIEFQTIPINVSGKAFSNLYSDFSPIEKPGQYIETKRDDGVVTKMYEPQVIANNNGMQIAVSFLKSQVGDYIAVVIGFDRNYKMLQGKMALRLSNNELLRFEPEKFQKTNLGKLGGVLGLFICPREYEMKIKQFKITNISLSFQDGSLNTYTIESNNDILIKQTKLLQ